ncbi:hypothetical protein [Polyangium sp. 6x1]|uniref:hypothetical protein n=1 Tax=Polyangium sp. 6x1 TaxID=3042689 RepID=UPI00248283A3|nr:hypothetical protein [Polyangium sp. 6x1]MDI1443454.1 hypothetical protein [Polyangium sp. 6x1]
MKKAEIDALVRAHRGSARAVAFLHVLRQPALAPDDHSFLSEHAHELTSADLLRWRARTPYVGRPPILVALAKLCEDKPAEFEHEVLNAPGLSFEDREWETLADLVRGKVPPALQARIARRETSAPAPAVAFFASSPHGGGLRSAHEVGHPLPPTPPADEPVDLAAMFDLDEATAPEASASKEGEGSFFGGGSLGDELGLDLGEDEGGPLFANPFAGLTVEDAFAKVTDGTNGDERAMLLDWLAAQGASAERLMSAALASLHRAPVASPVVAWIGKRLATKADWETNGYALFLALVERRAFPELQELVAQAAGVSPELGEARLAAFGHVLIDVTRDAIKKKDEARAAAALAALSALGATEETRKRFGALKQALHKAKASPYLVTLVDLVVARARTRGENPTEGMIAAVHALSDALGS